MSVVRRRRRRHRFLLPSLAAFSLLLLLSSAVTSAGAVSLRPFREWVGQGTTGSDLPGRFMRNNRLSGPGSSPPTCRSKCGKCQPCKPVHVPIQPGLITPLEYYPEAWRCKCGNKLFMP